MKISAIVPVYNTEKYVGRCIESVKEQSFSDWELILVDDGSKDGSLDVLKTYENKDSRIKVIHQDNAGPGLARNRGIKEASGEYIVFIDSDDIIKPNYFEKLSQETADIVFIDIDQVDTSLRVLRKEHMSEYKALSKDNIIRGQMTGRILWGGPRKAAKRQLIIDNNILFTDCRIGEEAIYSFLLLYYARSFAFISGSVYQYVNRDYSQSDIKDEDPWGDVVLELKKKIVSMGLYSKYANTLNAFFATAAIVSLNRIFEYYSGTLCRKKAKDRIKRYWIEIDNKYSIDVRHMPAKARLIYPFLKTGLLEPIRLASCINRVRRA